MVSNSNSSNNNSNNNNNSNMKEKEKKKVVVIMGTTGSGKSRLSIDIATRFASEIINSDKIQLYKGLDITTNKIPFHQRLNIPHHLLGEIDSSTLVEFSPTHYRYKAASVISSILSRHNLPLLVGGSNSYIYALLSGPGPSPTTDLRYDCCFLWIDIAEPVLNNYLVKRVDEMIDSGMVDELSEFYESDFDGIQPNTGLRKAIGVPEFERYFRTEGTDLVRYGVYQQAVQDVKDNTCRLAKAQLAKIQRLKNAGWDIHRLDGTDSFQAVLDGSNTWSDIWSKNVVEPSIKIVTNFLEE
ncbi:Adenylate isopentenyltransferase [Bienertia sinuspersici]